MSRHGLELDHDDGELVVPDLSAEELEAYAVKSGAAPCVLDALKVEKLDGAAALRLASDPTRLLDPACAPGKYLFYYQNGTSTCRGECPDCFVLDKQANKLH